MKNDKIITINGREYYKDTGLPVKKSKSPLKTEQKAVPSIKAIHSVAQRTQSLYSRTAVLTSSGVRTTSKRIGRSMDIARSKSISRFAPHSSLKAKPAAHSSRKIDHKPIKHPIAAKVEKIRKDNKVSSQKANATKPAKQIKEEAIKEALDKSANNNPPKKSFIKQHAKYFNLLTVGILLLVAAGYFVYLNLPNISVRIASAQAGINASFPEYIPDGYSLDGPVAYADGEISIKFRANGGQTGFIIKQSKSSWDSSAVKMQIDKESNGETTETKEKGRTIYTYDDNTKAAWVNGGILYTISGDAKLSGEQIRHIATSL